MPSLSKSPRAPFLDWIKTLADECRLGIVLLLRRRGEVCVTEIVKAFEVRQPTISHHLRVLRQAGIISCRKEGLWCYYTLNPAPMERLSQWFQRLSRMDVRKEVQNGI
jgi:ArsR family transcriptional regulator